MAPPSSSVCPSPQPPPPRWLAVLFPLLAGLLHLNVFRHALFDCVLPACGFAALSATFQTTAFVLDRAVGVAYVFDLICCALGFLPFSRCRHAREIIEHHAPTLLLALPLALPLWAGRRTLEPHALAALDLDAGEPRRRVLVAAYLRASGFMYTSSLNDVFMCFQRAEMGLWGVRAFRDVGQIAPQRRLFTSRPVLYAELCYKLAFFWGISVLACKACCDYDRAVHAMVEASPAYDGSIWRTVSAVYSSPTVLRGVLCRAFAVVMYPFMGLRTFKRIQLLHRGGKGAKKG